MEGWAWAWWPAPEQLQGSSNPRKGPALLVLPRSMYALHTCVRICISGLLIPVLPTCQHGGGVLGEEGHNMAALWGQPWIQHRGDAELDHGPEGAGHEPGRQETQPPQTSSPAPPVMAVLPLPWCSTVCWCGLLPPGGVPMGGLSEGLVQEVGALAVEMDGALVVGQRMAIAGIGGSQEAGQPIHRHWEWVVGMGKWGAASC